MKYLLMTHNAHNLGDVAMVESVIQHIHSVDKHPHITLESSTPELSQTYFPNIKIIPRYFDSEGIKIGGNIVSGNFIINNLKIFVMTLIRSLFLVTVSFLRFSFLYPQLLSVAKSSDVVISVAGDSISERYAYPLRFIEIGSISRVKDIILYAQSIGPFNGSVSKYFAKRYLSKAKLILARDQKTIELLKTYGVNTTINLTADSVISLVPNVTERSKEAVKRYDLTIETIAIVIRTKEMSSISDEEYERYINTFKKIISSLKKENKNIVITGTIPEDCDAGSKLLEQMGLDDIKVLRLYEFLPSEAKTILKNIGIIISPRMHPIILSTTVGVPAIAVIQEFKLKSYMSNIDLGDNVIQMSSINFEKLTYLINHTYKHRLHYTKIMYKPLERMKTLSLNNSKYLEGIISKIE